MNGTLDAFPRKAPERPENVKVDFDNGCPVALNGRALERDLDAADYHVPCDRLSVRVQDP